MRPRHCENAVYPRNSVIANKSRVRIIQALTLILNHKDDASDGAQSKYTILNIQF